MKRVILAVIAVLVMVTGASAADKYEKSVSDMVALLDECEANTAKIVRQCSDDAEGLTGAAKAVYLTSFYETRAKVLNAKYAGSQIVCGGPNTSGMLFNGSSETHIAGGRFTRWARKTKDSGISYELSSNLIHRLYDDSGNYITIHYDRENPRNSRFIDAKLPITLQANGAFVADGKGIAISSNELIEALNRSYDKAFSRVMSNMAYNLLLDPDFRASFVKLFVNQK